MLNKSFPLEVEYKDFSLGLDNASAPGERDNRSLADCLNFNLTRNKKVQKRKGCTLYQTSECGSSTNVNTIYEYKSPGGQYVSTYILAASGTVVYSYYNSTWNSVKTGLTNNLKMSNVTHMGLCYCVNGTDSNFKIFSDGVDLTGTPTWEARSATPFSLGIAAPTTAPTSALIPTSFDREYLSTNAYFKGLYDFVEFNSKLTVIDAHSTNYHISILATTDGDTWAEVYEVADDDAGYPNTVQHTDMCGSSVAVYDSKLFYNIYDSTSTNVHMGSWDGATTVAGYLTSMDDTNYYTYGLTNFDDNLFCISDVTPSIADRRHVLWFDGTTWTAIYSTGSYIYGVAYLDYNKADANSPNIDIKHRTTRLYEWGEDLYLFASRYCATGSKWAWEVFKFDRGSYKFFQKIYDSDEFDDDYVFAGIFEPGDGYVYVIGNLLDGNGNAVNQSYLYRSSDMHNWEQIKGFPTLGFCTGEVTYNDISYILCQEYTDDYTKVWRYDVTNQTFILVETIDTNVTSVEHGSIVFWNTGAEDRLFVGKYKEIYSKTVYPFSGIYKYKYTYKREAWKPFEGNPSEAVTSPDIFNDYGRAGVTASGDAQVNKIVLYRTLNDGVIYYKQGEHANTTATILDEVDDNDLTTMLEVDNTVPPKAKYLVLHKNRVVYLNLPSETDGESKIMWSKVSRGEAVPAVNYQYFDRDDGEDITGGASIGDALVVFKRNKIAVLTGDFDETSELYSMQYGVGALDHDVILAFEDKVIFLSEEGWKAFDGRNIYNLSDRVEGWRKDKYWTTTEGVNYKAVYYPDREQFLCLMKHSANTDIVTAGHFLIPLIAASQGAPEFAKGNLVGWTYHTYGNHTLTTLGLYTDSDNITRVLAGDSGGFIYELDDGTSDTNSIGTLNAIPYTFQTDWLDYGLGKTKHKVSRRCYISYTSSTTDNMTFNIERNFSDTDDLQTLACVTSGVGDADLKKVHISGRAKVFRYTLSSAAGTKQDLGIMSITILFRDEGTKR